ncbi:hypothetical protein B5X24_HaOG208175 [Helicoverpa armigera]|uniref:Uncharacterized protein n=1 Tax=Helicoverpa armigera TaxID=29058 RepID=A0A2W1BGM8_HELAM|nr:hypothetical protein B5X24_HaOG208175 [Helicoverpa armigera]
MKIPILLTLTIIFAFTEAKSIEWKADYGKYPVVSERMAIEYPWYRYNYPLYRYSYPLYRYEYPVPVYKTLVKSYDPEYYYKHYGYYPEH